MVQEISAIISERTEKSKELEREKKSYRIHQLCKMGAAYFILIGCYIVRTRQIAVDVARAEAGAKILDVGSGSGEQAFAFANRGFEVTGIDISEDQLKRAIKGNKYKNLNFEVADATALPFPDSQFDVSCITLVLHEVSSNIRLKVLQEMVRVTKPQGQIMIVDHALPANKLGRFLTYYLVKACESEYYPDFVHSDLNADLARLGIKVNKENSILFGSGRILKASNQKACGILPDPHRIIFGQNDSESVPSGMR